MMLPHEEPVPLEPLMTPEIAATISPEGLAPGHFDILTQAIQNILTTDVAKFTYAQIIDGLPTTSSFMDFHLLRRDSDHPVQSHTVLCDGVMDKARAFRSEFNPLSLRFEPHVLQDFQNQEPGSRAFELLLIELVSVACHQIAVFLFHTEGQKHKLEYDTWLAEQVQLRDAGSEEYRYHSVEPPTVFYHRCYCEYEQYPHGVSDMVGYWAESKIFGGVVLFDRSDSNANSKEVFFNQSCRNGPWTTYPLTVEQFDTLRNFLISPTGDMACPLPIHATKENRPRYDIYHATKYFHIFRNRYEQRLPVRFLPPSKISARDHPELEDDMWLLNYSYDLSAGKIQPDEAAVKAVEERRKKISPSSPLWPGGCNDPRYR